MYEAHYNDALNRLLREGVPLDKARFQAHTVAARRVAVAKRLNKREAAVA